MLLALPDVVVPSQDAIDRAKIGLERRLGPSKATSDPATCATYAADESDARGRTPDVVVFASSREDVIETLAVAREAGVPVTPRAAGTGRTGGAVPVAGGIVLSIERMRSIKEIHKGDLVCVVEPGVVLADLHAAVEAEGLFYPPDPNSAASCTIGGNLAENAGGPRAFKYGVTSDYALGVEACLIGGAAIRMGRRTAKGVTGYDVTSLLVGSEGTLAVFTEATLKLVPLPPAVATALALFGDVHAAARAVLRLTEKGIVPRCAELLDGPTLDAVRAHKVPIDPRAGAMLLLEADADPERELERIGEALAGMPGLVDLVVATDRAACERLWEGRRALSRATRRLAKYKLSEDVVVPRSKIGELLDRVDAIGAETGVRYLTYGHAGDGNLHVNFLWNEDAERPAVDRAIGLLMRGTIALGGTLSGEHGIGIAKAPYLSLEQSPELIALQRDLKRVFDPEGLLNPGKIFASSAHKAC